MPVSVPALVPQPQGRPLQGWQDDRLSTERGKRPGHEAWGQQCGTLRMPAGAGSNTRSCCAAGRLAYIGATSSGPAASDACSCGSLRGGSILFSCTI